MVTYNVKDSQAEEQVVEDAMNLLSGELPDGDDVAQEADDADEADQETLGGPLEVVHGNPEAVLRLGAVFEGDFNPSSNRVHSIGKLGSQSNA